MSGYDEHQRLRTRAVRLLAKKNYPAAITLLHDGSVRMLEAKEQGSGCDLGIYMIDVYTQAGTKADKESRDRILDIVKLAKPDFWRKKLTDSIVKWSASATGTEYGDPILRYEIAKLFSKEGSYHQAEPHFHAAILPPSVSAEQPSETQDAAKELGKMMAEWLAAHAEKSVEKMKETQKDGPDAAVIQRIEAGRFALRGLLTLLTAGKVPAAHAYLKSFLTTIISTPACKNLPLPTGDNPRTFSAPPGLSPPARRVAPPGESKDYVQPLWITANADINFAQMCLGLVDCSWRIKGEAEGLSKSERGVAPAPEALRSAWIALARQFVKEGLAGNVDQIVGESINSVSSLYFDLQPPRAQGNMLADMMSSFFGGASGGAGASSAPAPAGAKWVTFRQPREPEILEEEEEEESSAAVAPVTAVAGTSVAPPVAEDLD